MLRNLRRLLPHRAATVLGQEFSIIFKLQVSPTLQHNELQLVTV